MSASAAITPELLDAMLAPPSPGGGGGDAAEATYRSIPVADRVRGLTSALRGSADAGAAARAALAAILLRRDLSALPPADPATAPLLSGIAGPLADLFFSARIVDGGARRQCGRCVAEVGAALSAADAGCGAKWLAGLMGRMGPGCGALDVPHLRLLSDVADRCPAALWSSDASSALPTLLSGRPGTPEQLEAFAGALCQCAVAFERVKRASSLSEGKGGLEAMILAQLSEGCTDVDPDSPPAQLGRMFLPATLEALVGFSSSPDRSAGVLSKCVAHIAACAEECPSLMAADDACLSALIRSCVAVAKVSNPEQDEEVSFLKLSVLDVLATIVSVPKVRTSIHKASSPSPRSVGEAVNGTMSPLLNVLINGEESDGKGVLYLCADLAVAGVDEDETAWAEEPPSLHDAEGWWEEDRTALHAESLFESFVEGLGGSAALPNAFQLVDALLSLGSWREQRAALSVLERCLAAAPATFVPHADAAVDAALRGVGGTSFRAQWQGISLLGALCQAEAREGDASPGPRRRPTGVREKHGRTILEAAAARVRSPCTRVASHACLLIVSYCRGGDGLEDCGVPLVEDQIGPYVGALLDALRAGPLAGVPSDPSAVEEGTITVLVRAIGATACLAAAAGTGFAAHYGVVSGLMACARLGLQVSGRAVVVTPGVRKTHDLATLRGAAIEAATIVGQAVSGEGENVAVYEKDASEIVTLAIGLLDEGDNELIPPDRLLAACARVAAVMGGRYAPFVPAVLPHILRPAAEELEVSVVDAADRAGDGEGEDDGGHVLNLPGAGSKRVRINTAQLEEKSRAARALYEHARALGADFGPHVAACAKVFLPLVTCQASGDVRSTAAQALSQVFKAACLADVEDGGGRAQELLAPLAAAIVGQLAEETDENEVEDRHAIADALSEVLWDAYEHEHTNGRRVAQITSPEARDLVPRLMSLIGACLASRSALAREAAERSFDEDSIARCEDRARAEAEYLTHLVDSVGYQLKSLREGFAPVWAEFVAGPLGQLLTDGEDVRARLAAMCLYDDCIEHCGPEAAATYAPALVQGIRVALDKKAGDLDEDGVAQLRRAACYGIAQVARRAPGSLSPDMGHDLVGKAYNIAREAASVSKGDMEYPALVENAISAMASLALFPNSPAFNSMSDKKALMEAFFLGLPLEEDFDEAQICHDGLCDLVESDLIDVRAQYRALIRIIGKILALVSEGDNVATQGTCSRLIGVIDKIQQTVDGTSIQNAFSELETDAQQALLEAMQ